ncbi:FxsA domain protein [Candidatus Nanohalobium constans]|uniref:FxsA domain protein n=2 Tax=Candidatus Nanohalobium constans TaxID=2565781 RepID=A0A5Q0UG56_9ARCH|nr:FxsA domain protein [Candidatus Nanohalobium constans]
MYMLRYILITVLLLPFIDFYILVEVAGSIGILKTLLISIVTGLIGAELVRREGRHVFQKLQRSVTGGEITRNFMEGFILVLAGLMLLSPGFVTDILGAVIAVRPVRERLVAKLMNSKNTAFEVEFQRF